MNERTFTFTVTMVDDQKDEFGIAYLREIREIVENDRSDHPDDKAICEDVQRAVGVILRYVGEPE